MTMRAAPRLSRRRVLAAAGASAFIVSRARAQDPSLPLIAYLEPISGASPTNRSNVAAFWQGLGEHGFVEGKTAAFAAWYAEGDIDKLPALAAEVVARKPAVILASTPNAARPLKALTKTIPIVFAQAADAIDNGEVTDAKHPEANLTGIANYNELNPQRLEWLLKAAPKAKTVGYISDPNLGSFPRNLSQAQEAADKLKRRLIVGKAANDTELAAALAMLGTEHADALMIGPIRGASPRPREIVALTARLPVPVMFYDRAFVDAGGLMSFGAAFQEIYRLAGTYAGRILKGAKVSDLPVLQPGSYELVLNAGAAKAIGLSFPSAVSAAAHDIIS